LDIGHLGSRPDNLGSNELRIVVSMSYRTLLTIFSLFVVLSRLVDTIVDAFS